MTLNFVDKTLFSKIVTGIMLTLFGISACTPVITQTSITSTTQPTPTPSQTLLQPSLAPTTPTVTSSPRASFGPTSTSTPLPAFEAHTWQAAPVMIEAAMLVNDPGDPFPYTPFLILYGDGLLVIRACEEDECRYLQAQLSDKDICQLINTIDRTGFLNVDPQNSVVPPGTGTEIRMMVNVFQENVVQIPDLNRWVERPDWYPSFVGCQNCYDLPNLDPAINDLYRLLSTYSPPEPSGLQTDRLALWLTQPVIMGTPQAWDNDLIPLASLAEDSLCQDNTSQRQAVILEGTMAYSTASFLSGQQVPLFTDGPTTWQVHSRWLLPFEMPQTCDHPAGLFPPAIDLSITWHCEPGMGSLPTSTPTITPTPTVTPTPLR